MISNLLNALWYQGRLVLALLALALFLAVLGRLTGASRAPPVVLGNLLGGFALFALSCRLVQASAPATHTPPGLGPWTLAALVLLLLQIALGGLVSAGAAGAGCDAGGACTVHGAGAFVLAALLLALAWAAWRGRARRSAATLALLLLAQGALGLRLAAGDPPLALALAHNLGAALLLAALLALLPAPRR
jgi:cytochrome c oxidase assembly protein subunit 15